MSGLGNAPVIKFIRTFQFHKFTYSVCSVLKERNFLCRRTESVEKRTRLFNQCHECPYKCEQLMIGPLQFELHKHFHTASVKNKNKNMGQQDDSDDEVDELSLEDLKDTPESDPNVPQGYRTKLTNSDRADRLIQKGLNYTNKEVEQLFYSSKFLYKGKTLLKKATKIHEGEHIDVLHADADKNSVLVQRVKVLKIFKGTTKKGNPKVAIRVWAKPFESKS